MLGIVIVIVIKIVMAIVIVTIIVNVIVVTIVFIEWSQESKLWLLQLPLLPCLRLILRLQLLPQYVGFLVAAQCLCRGGCRFGFQRLGSSGF